MRALIAEGLGTLLLVATVVGSGIMAESLAGGNTAIALLGNTIATGAILFVLISVFGNISGAHFNPAVTLVFLIRGEIAIGRAIGFWVFQIAGGILGTLIAHFMFELDIVQFSETARTGVAQWGAEIVATFGLVITILGCVRYHPEKVAMAVGLYITAAYWFTASTSFANPAVTIARSLSDTFSGIAPADMPIFIVAQLIGAVCAGMLGQWLFQADPDSFES